MSTAVAYIRKSSAPSKHTRTVSFEVQEQAVRELAARNGDELSSILSDWGKSGGSAKRPDYQRMLAMIDAREVDTIYSFSLSRLSRSLLDFADLLERCRRGSVRVRLVQEGDIDWSTATGRAFAGMAALFAQFERELGSERNQAAVDERRDRGDVLGQPPYGYANVAGKLVRREDEDPGLVIKAYREAGSFAGAARLLREWDVPTRRPGTKWIHGTVADIVRQQAPADLRPALVKRPGATPIGRGRLTALLRCHCGATLTPRRERGRMEVRGYYCARSSATPGHGRMYVAEAALLDALRSEADHLSPPYDQVQVGKQAERDLEAIERKRTRVVDMYVEGVIGKPQRDDRLRALDTERDRLLAHTAWVDIPAIDWSKPAPVLNTTLRALWEYVQLDREMRPISYLWRVPEWRA